MKSAALLVAAGMQPQLSQHMSAGSAWNDRHGGEMAEDAWDCRRCIAAMLMLPNPLSSFLPQSHATNPL
jgi:hypothetical protein